MSITHFSSVTPAVAPAIGSLVSLDNLTNIAVTTLTSVGVSTSCSAGVEFTAAGVLNELRGTGIAVPTSKNSLSPDYNDPAGGVGLEVRLTVVSGSGPNGGSLSANTWTAMTSDIDCYQTITTALSTTRTGVWRFEIRAGTDIVATSADVTIAATIDVI